jgi:hypothetical protein
MADPIELRQFRHFLNFKNDDTGRVEISELVKFDASQFVIEQNEKGYARDITLMNEESNLEFYKGFFEQAETPYQLPNTLVVDKLGHAIEHIFEYDKRYGAESEIEYILEQNGIEFVTGEVHMEGSETDESTYFKCKIIQASDRALAKRREDTKIDMFSDVDLDGNTITPLSTERVLLKAKPENYNGQWRLSKPYWAYTYTITGNETFHLHNQNPINVVAQNTIEGNLSFIDRTMTTYTGDPNRYNKIYNFGYIDAQEDLTNVTIKLSDFKFSYFIQQGVDFASGWGNFRIISLTGVVLPQNLNNYTQSDVIDSFSFNFKHPDETANFVNQDVFSYQFIGTESIDRFGLTNLGGYADRYDITLPDVEIQNGEYLIQNIPRGSRLCLYWSMGRNGTITEWISGNKKISVTSTAIDTVINAARYIDLAKQSLKAINGFDLISPEFDQGGQFYNLFAFSGNLIRQRDDVPFYVTFKDRRENLMLFNADIQINEQDAFTLQYNKFYDNVDNGGFLLAPNQEFKRTYNPRYRVNLLEWRFTNYEKDRDEENTLESVHTEAQFSINNKKAKATKLIQIDDIFDGAKIESQRRQTVKTTTSLDGDDKNHVMDMIPLPPSARNGFTSSMTHQVDGNELKLLKDADLPSWALLGFDIGVADFEITEGENQGVYSVTAIEDNIITLFGSPSGFNGVSLTTVEYPLSNVLWTNRTNEQFDLIEGISNPERFGNLRYTIRRNLVHWESYISTCAEYIEDDVKNTYFKNNGELRTQFNGGEIYQENADIVLDNIQGAILTPKMYDIELIVGYEDMLTLIRKYQQLATVGGFIRVQDTNGLMKKVYPKDFGYTWATSLLSSNAEERKESDIIVITRDGDNLIIDGATYDDNIGYETQGEYLAIFDENNIKIVNFTKYDRFEIQGATFDNITDLTQAIIDL